VTSSNRYKNSKANIITIIIYVVGVLFKMKQLLTAGIGHQNCQQMRHLLPTLKLFQYFVFQVATTFTFIVPWKCVLSVMHLVNSLPE